MTTRHGWPSKHSPRPDTDLDLMMDSLQARLRDMQAEVDG
jgi:hypothetical protein